MSNSRGFSLIELTAVIAVFALVATMGLQALQGTLRARDRLADRDAETREIARALTLLRQDLAAIAPLVFLRPDGTEAPPLSFDAEAGRLEFTVAGRGGMGDGPTSGAGRAVWALNLGATRLDRQVWPTLIPASGAAASPAQPLLPGIVAMDVAVYDDGEGWIPTEKDETYGGPGGLPLAIEVRLTHLRLGPIAITVTF